MNDQAGAAIAWFIRLISFVIILIIMLFTDGIQRTEIAYNINNPRLSEHKQKTIFFEERYTVNHWIFGLVKGEHPDLNEKLNKYVRSSDTISKLSFGTRRSANDVLIAALSFGIYVPITVTVHGEVLVGIDSAFAVPSIPLEDSADSILMKRELSQGESRSVFLGVEWPQVYDLTPWWALFIFGILLLWNVIFSFIAFNEYEEGWGAWGIFSSLLILLTFFIYAFFWPGSIFALTVILILLLINGVIEFTATSDF